MFNTEIIKDGSNLEIKMEGKLDTTSFSDFDKIIKENIDDTESVVINMKELKYLSSAGLRSILSLHKAMAEKNGLTIKNVNETIMEIFSFTGFSDILNIK